MVIGTQNPIESEGTYPLPEAQLDRFLFRMSIGYPTLADETVMVKRRALHGREHVVLPPVLEPARVEALQRAVDQVHVSDQVADYLVRLVTATRQSPATELGASPRGSLALLRAGRAWAALAGRDFVLPDDIKAVAVPALAHRLILDADQWIRGVRTEDIVRSLLDEVPAPAAADDR